VTLSAQGNEGFSSVCVSSEELSRVKQVNPTISRINHMI
jgi:hypothetical protein